MNSGEPEAAETAEKSPGDEEMFPAMACPWKPPAVKPKSYERGARVVAGLASLLREKP